MLSLLKLVVLVVVLAKVLLVVVLLLPPMPPQRTAVLSAPSQRAQTPGVSSGQRSPTGAIWQHLGSSRRPPLQGNTARHSEHELEMPACQGHFKPCDQQR